MAKPVTRDHLRSSKKPNIAKVTIVLDPDAADRYTEAKDKYDRAKIRMDVRREDPDLIDDFEAAQAWLDEVRSDIEEDVFVFEFKALGRKKYEKLLSDHPATEAQQAEAKKEKSSYGFNPETFPPALVFACMVDNELTWEDFMEEVWDGENWAGSETTALYLGAMSANADRKTVDMGNG